MSTNPRPISCAKIHQLLGHIHAFTEKEDEHVLVWGTPTNNSTRWIFDVQHPGGTLYLQLAFRYSSQENKKQHKSFSLLPLSESFWDARPWIEEDVDHIFKIHAKTSCKMRVTVDTVHSSTS